MKITKYIIIFFLSFFYSCAKKIKTDDFNFFLSEPCMILNYEQDNTIEGTYLVIEKIQIEKSSIEIDLPKNIFINNCNIQNWVIGWGINKPFYDAGCENIRLLKEINNDKIILGELVRGKGFPSVHQRIVFWNKNPSNFVNQIIKPIIIPTEWTEFAGESIHFGSIEFDKTLNKWIMFLNESDTSKIQIYAAMSDNLINWQPANNNKPVLTASDFNRCRWTGKDRTGKINQTPFISDIVNYKNKWFLFFHGYSSDGKRHIGIATSDESILGPYEIFVEPVLSPGKKGSWNDESCFYAKIEKYNDCFIMFYDGRNKKGMERVGMATSKDLISWDNYDKNPVIDEHTGWRSSEGVTEPNFIEIRNDTIFLMIAGSKKLNMGPWHHYVTKRMYLDKSGNVDDTQLGVYMSLDGGKSFIANKNNPVFTNDYSNLYENEHMGADFIFIKTDTVDFIFYQAKSSFNNLKYNIMLRTKKKNVL